MNGIFDSGPNPFAKGPYSGLSTSTDAYRFPDRYDFTDALADVKACDINTPILGIAGDGYPEHLDVESESPHVLIAGGTGGCKSGIGRSLFCQMLAKGAQGIVLDGKKHSQTWAKGLPNVAYAETFQEIGNAWVFLGEEVNRRNEIVRDYMMEHFYDGAKVEDAPVGPWLIVLAEELNATMGRLMKMGNSYEAAGSRRPKNCPALDGMGDVMFMGRAAKIVVIAIAQYASAVTMGGGDIRENFNTRIMVNYSRNQWNMLAKEVDWPKAAPHQKGRGFTVRSGKAHETQYLYVTEQQARQYVLDSLPKALPPGH